MKITTLTREHDPELNKVYKNTDPKYHPFEKQREYTASLNTVKINSLLAKPFLTALNHTHGVHTMSLLDHTLLTGTISGELCSWELSTFKKSWSVDAHKGFLTGITFVSGKNETASVLSCGIDKTIKCWNQGQVVSDWKTKSALNSMDAHPSQSIFVTSSSVLDIWDVSRDAPLYSMNWGAESIYKVKWNKLDPNVIASCGSDRSIVLYDIRTKTPLTRMVMAMQTNALCWNPMEAFNFTTAIYLCANEDHNCYTFDMRSLSHALAVSKDHVSAVLDIDYSPTGQEFVTGSYDKTIRIFGARDGKSRQVYHTKRMQKVFASKFTLDGKFVLSGSDDGNARLWKANASQKLGMLSRRETTKLEYSNAVKERYKHLPEIKRIDRHRRLPKSIKSATQKKHIMSQSQKRKLENVRKHGPEGKNLPKPERKRQIIAVEK